MINQGFGALVDFGDLGAAGALVDLRIEIGLRFEAEGKQIGENPGRAHAGRTVKQHCKIAAHGNTR